MLTMRDAFWDEIYNFAKNDKNVVIVSADFSAPSLDKFRSELSAQYVKMGITEQAMILVASGMALEGKRPFCYAIAPFLTMRCFEQIRLYPAAMNLPVVLVGVGAGVAYSDSGLTHHALEDVSIIRALPNMRIFQPCDNETTRKMASMLINTQTPVYLRLDRYAEEKLVTSIEDVETGINVIKEPRPITILASGYMVKKAIQVADQLAEQGIEVGVLDACILPIDSKRLKNVLTPIRKLVTLEEHTLAGGLGSYILECVNDQKLPIHVTRIGADLMHGYIEEYSSRDAIHEQLHLDITTILEIIKELDN